MRVLLISHTCMSRTEGQPKAELLGRTPGVRLRVLVPDRWSHYGLEWRAPELPPADSSFEFEVRKVALPWVGPLQWHAHWYPTLARTLRDFQPEVIDIWEESWMCVSAQAVWLRNRLLPGARVITETEQNIHKRLPPPFERMRAYTLRHADHAVARSRGAAEVLRAKGFSKPIDVVPNAVDAELFRPPAAAAREASRRELGFDGFVAAYVGRLVPEKGLTDMVDALPHCPPGARVAFLGTGPMRDELQRRAEALGVADRALFLTGRPLHELPAIVGALDALVLPSRTTPRWKEQFGRVIIEAHACGTPVIGSSSGAIPDVVGAAGEIFPEGDVKALAAAMAKLAADPSEARRLGAVGRAQVERHYTWRRVADRMASIYAKVGGISERGRVQDVAAAPAFRPSVPSSMVRERSTAAVIPTMQRAEP